MLRFGNLLPPAPLHSANAATRRPGKRNFWLANAVKPDVRHGVVPVDQVPQFAGKPVDQTGRLPVEHRHVRRQLRPIGGVHLATEPGDAISVDRGSDGCSAWIEPLPWLAAGDGTLARPN